MLLGTDWGPGAAALVIALLLGGVLVRWAGKSSLSEDEQRFRKDLMDRVTVAEGEIRHLQSQINGLNQQLLEAGRRELAWGQRELAWSAAYAALDTLYRALVERLGPGANAPPPPMPPPPLEGMGGGITTGPSPRPRTMPSQDRATLLHLLEGTALGGGTRDRDSLLLGLPDGYKTQVQRSERVRDDLGNMIQTALDWGGDPPLLSAWLDNVCDALGGDESEKVRAIQDWRKQKRW